MKRLLLALLVALFANASEIDLLKVATGGKVSGKSYVVAQNEAKNVKAGWYSRWFYNPYHLEYGIWHRNPHSLGMVTTFRNTYTGIGSYHYNLNTRSGYSSSRAGLLARYFGSWYWGKRWR